MIVREQRKRPDSWSVYSARFQSPWVKPFFAIEWLFTWTAHLLSRWVFLEVLEYLGTFSILVAVIFYFAESGDRVKQRHYQAWQVINTAQGKGGSGGRIEALHELNQDGVPLVGIDLRDAFLQGVRLDDADLSRSEFGSADLRNSSFRSAKLEYAVLNSANLRGSVLRRANLAHADMGEIDLSEADLSEADLTAARLDAADLRGANLASVKWEKISSIKLANIFGAKSVPAGFRPWALKSGAVSLESDKEWNDLQATAGGQK